MLVSVRRTFGIFGLALCITIIVRKHVPPRSAHVERPQAVPHDMLCVRHSMNTVQSCPRRAFQISRIASNLRYANVWSPWLVVHIAQLSPVPPPRPNSTVRKPHILQQALIADSFLNSTYPVPHLWSPADDATVGAARMAWRVKSKNCVLLWAQANVGLRLRRIEGQLCDMAID